MLTFITLTAKEIDREIRVNLNSIGTYGLDGTEDPQTMVLIDGRRVFVRESVEEIDDLVRRSGGYVAGPLSGAGVR